MLQTLIAVAQDINDDVTMLWRVEVLSVFGSYLTDKAVLGDLDIGVRLLNASRNRNEDIPEARERFFERYPPPAYIRRDFFSRLVWPETFVRRRLRVGRNISFHEQSEVECEGYPHRIFFEAAREQQAH